MNPQKIANPSTEETFAGRITLLIQRVGSATKIARMCGFSEGVVRSWRDGSTDPSRARCVTLARTLGISLVWLVAGEGGLAPPDLSAFGGDDQRSSDSIDAHIVHSQLTRATDSGTSGGMDTQRLNTAMRMLQSELDLANSPLSLSENTDLLTQLYGLLSTGGAQVEPVAMMAFNHRLAERIRESNQRA
ncbi:MAG: transcriptional regulator [Rhodanobacter sp.]